MKIIKQKKFLKVNKNAAQTMMKMINNTKYKGHTSPRDCISKRITANTIKKELEELKQLLVNA